MKLSSTALNFGQEEIKIMRSLIAILLFAFTLFFQPHATVFEVGSTKNYVSPNALYLASVVQAGDTIRIDSETYAGNACLAAWSADSLLIQGVGGRPILQANGQYIQGKGIWVISGDACVVENIEFTGATVPDKNGAGIRIEGEGITIRHCYFHHNEDGILTNSPYAGHILIEYSEFAYNGYGDGFSHNLYVNHVGRLTFRFNYTHHSDVGHCLKSRADENIIVYNRIMDENTGNSSRLIDLPNGGLAIVMGNIMMQGPAALNNNLIGYGLEGLTNTTPHDFYFINNTCVNKRVASCIFVSIKSGTNIANVSNNIFAGDGTLVNGTTTTMTNNLADTSISNMMFVDEPNYDYHTTALSPSVDAGKSFGFASGESLTPDSAYLHLASAETRINFDSIDVGAYEYVPPMATSSQEPKALLYPNPAGSYLSVSGMGDLVGFQVFDLRGTLLAAGEMVNGRIEIENLNSGRYFLRLNSESRTWQAQFIKSE